jgi:hypothetical protein
MEQRIKDKDADRSFPEILFKHKIKGNDRCNSKQ